MAVVVDRGDPLVIAVAVVPTRGFLTLTDGTHDSEPAPPPSDETVGTITSGTTVVGLTLGGGVAGSTVGTIEAGTDVVGIGARRGRPLERNWTGFEGGRMDVCLGTDDLTTVEHDGHARSGAYYCRHSAPITPAAPGFTDSKFRRRETALGTGLAIGEQARTVMRVFVRLRQHVGADGCCLCGAFAFSEQQGQVLLDTTGHFAALAYHTASSYSSAALALHVWYRVDLTHTVTQLTGAPFPSARTETSVSIYTNAGVLVETVSASSDAFASNATLPIEVSLGNVGEVDSTFVFEFDDWFWCSGEMGDVADVQLPAATRVFGVSVTGQDSAADWTGAALDVAERPRDGLAGQTTTTAAASTTFTHDPAALLGITAIAGIAVRANLNATVTAGTDALLLAGVAYPVAVDHSVPVSPHLAVDVAVSGVVDLPAFNALAFGVRNLRGSPLALDNIFLEVLGQGVRVYRFRIRQSGFQIHDTMGEAPTTLSMVVEGEQPPGNALVRLGLEDDTLQLAATIAGSEAAAGVFGTGPLLFEGVLQTVEQHYDGQRTQLAWSCTAIDHVYDLNKRRPFGSFDDVAAHVVIETIMAAYAPGFDVAFVQQIMIPITITLDGSLTLAGCLSAIATQLGACHWYLDGFALHFYHVGTNDGDMPVETNPDPPDPMTVVMSATPAVGPFIQLSWMVYCVTLVYSNGLESQPSDIVLLNVTAGFCVDVADLPIGAPLLGLPVVKRYLYMQIVGFRGTGVEPPPAWFVYVIPNNTATTLRIDGTAGPNARRQPPLRPDPAPGPTTAPTIAFSAGNTNLNSISPGPIRWAVGYVYETGVHSAPGPRSNWITNDGNDDLVTVTDIPIGVPNVDGKAVLFRAIYQDFDGRVFGGLHLIPNNTDTTREVDLSGFGDPTPIHPAEHVEFADGPPTTGGATFGPSLEDDLTPPDVLTDDSPTLIHSDPPLTSSLDDSQVRTRVLVVGATRPLTVATLTTDTILTLDTAIFDVGGGTVLVNGVRILYASIGSGTLVLPAGATVGEEWPIGTTVALFVQCDDYLAQAELGEQEAVDGVPSDGIREFTLTDTSLDSVARCIARGQAELVLWSRPILTVNYGTFDRKTRAGRLVAINLTHPPLVHPGLLIQDVRIDRVAIGPTAWAPRYTVTASSVRFTLDDLLRRVALTN